jgi:hypothetical protein
MAHFDVENLVQQWYGDMSFGGFSYGFEVVPVLLTLNLQCLPVHLTMMKTMKKVEKRVKNDE